MNVLGPIVYGPNYMHIGPNCVWAQYIQLGPYTIGPNAVLGPIVNGPNCVLGPTLFANTDAGLKDALSALGPCSMSLTGAE